MVVDKNELTEIVKLVQEDRSQFEKLYHLIINKVYFWCYSMTGNKDDANDLSQEAMLLIYRKIDTLEYPEYFTSWMYKTVRRVGYNQSRKSKGKYYSFLENDDFNESITNQVEDKRIDSMPEMALNLKQTKELMLNFIENLPRKQKEVVYLHYLEELRIDEIADILDYNAGTIKASLFKARQNLKGQIESYQMKNDIRLYSIGFIPLVVLAFNEYVNDICKVNTYTYNPKQFQSKLGTFLHSQLLSLPSMITTLAVALVVVGTAIYITGYQQNGNDTSIISEEKISMMNDKLKKNEYILSYRYYHFPSESILVSIELSQAIADEEISVVFNSKEILTQQRSTTVYFQAEENGTYEINVKKEKVLIKIENITEDAPNLKSVYNNVSNDYLQLDIDGNKQIIDYSKSYILYENTKYLISDDNIVKGQFKGELQVILFDKENNYIEYDVVLSEQ